MSALTTAFIIAAILCFMAAVFSALRGGKYICKEKEIQENKTNSNKNAYALSFICGFF
jgi:hypothetical protein